MLNVCNCVYSKVEAALSVIAFGVKINVTQMKTRLANTLPRWAVQCNETLANEYTPSRWHTKLYVYLTCYYNG